MWIFCGFGYFSVIEHRKDKDLLLVRSRVKGDLEQLKAKCLPNLGEIVETPTGADYPYRALAWRVEFAEAMKKAVEKIDYTNFKSGISKTQGSARHDLYMRVWSIMKAAESTMKRIEEDDAKRSSGPQQTSWVGYNSGWWEEKDDGRFGGKGAKGNKGSYQRTLDLDASRAARNKRLGLSGVSEHMLKHQKEDVETKREAHEARRRVEALVAKQLKGTEHDFDRLYEDEIDTPPSNWIDAADRFLQDHADQDQIDPTVDYDGE